MSKVEVTFVGNAGRKVDDVQALRALLEGLEAHERGPHPQGSHAVWETKREVLVARVNAYSALVIRDAAETLKPPPFPREIAKLIHGPLGPTALATLRELVPKHYAEETTSVVMCTTCARPMDECMRDRRGHRYTSSPA